AVISATRPLLSEGSAIVNFASVDAFTVSPGQLLYGASKAAVVMLTKELALELAPMNIRVNAFAPGWVTTPGNAATGRMAAAAHSIPLGRAAQPEEIAAWVELLGSETGAFMSGRASVLSGGDGMRSLASGASIGSVSNTIFRFSLMTRAPRDNCAPRRWTKA